MTSIYAIRLYELLMQWKSTGVREVEIDWLKKQFDIEDLYPDMCDLKKRVIEPAIKDINIHSDYQVSWTQRKTGRRVTHLTFQFGEKAPAKAKTKEKCVLGVAVSEIEKLARPGESWEEAAKRIKGMDKKGVSNAY
jgi:plasmid replication initiation protein